MENIQTITNLIIAIVSLIPTLVSIYYLVKNIATNKDWKTIEQMIRTAMTSAECYAKEHVEMTGKDKLDMAIEAVKAGCAACGIAVDDNLVEKITACINQLCDWSKTVNKK